MPVLLGWAALGLIGVWGLHEANQASTGASKLLWSGAAAGAVYIAGKRLKAW